MGKGAFPEDDPLAAGSACDEPAFRELLEEADVVLAAGTQLGAETTGQYELALRGRLIQIDAAPERIGATYPALGLVGDVRAMLGALLDRVDARPGDGAERVASVRNGIAERLEAQDRGLERGLLETIRAALPRDAVTAWDMTILAYWAAAHFPALAPRRFLYPLGSGTLGYAWPAALGASLALSGTPTLAVVGDGGFLYGLAELATARQYGLRVVLLVVDDGGYGILREYQRESYDETIAVDLVQPDFVALAQAFGVAAELLGPEELRDAVKGALAAEGPVVLHLPTLLRMWAPAA